MADTNWLKGRQTMLQRKADLIFTAGERRDPPGLTDDEKKDLTAIEKEMVSNASGIEGAESEDAMIARGDQMTGGALTGSRTSASRSAGHGRSAGALFAANEDVSQFIRGGGHRASGGWRSPAVEVPYGAMFATTLTESPTSGGKLVVPD